MTPIYYSGEPLVPFRRVGLRARINRGRMAKAPASVLFRRGVKQRPKPARLVRRMAYDITGSVGVRQTGAAVGAPLFVMPYAEPGLGEMWTGHLEDQQLAGIFSKVKKAVKKVVKSKAFKVVAVAAAAYYGGPVAAKAIQKAWEIRSKIKAASAAAKASMPPPLTLPPPVMSEQITLPPGYYWDAAGNVHDQAGNIYDRDGNLISSAAAPAAGGFSEAATSADPAGTIPGEFPALPTKTPSTPGAVNPAAMSLLGGIDGASLLKMAAIGGLAYVAVKAAGGSGGGRRRRRR